MLQCALLDPARFSCELLCGPETGSEGELHTECRARGVRLHVEPALIRALHPWNDLVCLLRLARFIRRGRFELVHTHSSKAGILGRLAARLAGARRVVHTVHGWAFNAAQPRHVFWAYVWLERCWARLCDRLIVVAAADRDEGLALGIGRPEQYVLIRSGIEIEAYRDVAVDRPAARARIGLPSEGFVVGCIGRLSPQKAPLDMVAGFERLAATRPDARLVMVGDGPLRGAVEQAATEKGLRDRVHLLGLRRDVPELLRAFDVFALPSHWEGLPRVFPQAMAAALPIVATHVDGASDAIEDGETGWLVEVGDTATLGRRLIELAADPARVAAMGGRARDRVEEFSARRMIAQVEQLYASLLEHV